MLPPFSYSQLNSSHSSIQQRSDKTKTSGAPKWERYPERGWLGKWWNKWVWQWKPFIQDQPPSAPRTHTHTHPRTHALFITPYGIIYWQDTEGLLCYYRTFFQAYFSGRKLIFPELIDKHNLNPKSINILLAHFTVYWWVGAEQLSVRAENFIWKKAAGFLETLQRHPAEALWSTLTMKFKLKPNHLLNNMR